MDQRPRPGRPEKKAGAASDLAEGLVMLSQFGLSVAAGLGLCLWGAGRLRSRYGLGDWVLLLGVALGLWMAVGSFRSIGAFLKNRDAWKKKQQLEQAKKEARAREVRQDHRP